MENAADALKMAAAVLIFVIALATAMFGFTKARQAASAINRKSDNTRYYDSENLDITDSRIVGIETVIPTLYSYFKEGYTVLFYEANWNSETQQPENIRKMTLYYTEALPNDLVNSRLRITDNVIERGIYGLDSDDESVRRELWIDGRDATYKNFIMSLINRERTQEYDFSRDSFNGSNNYRDSARNKLAIDFHYNFGGNNALSEMTTAKFLERSGIYNVNRLKAGDLSNPEDISTSIDVEDSKIEFEGDVSAENSGVIQKKVIQYIYLRNF